jgi:hypothetical protein
MGHFAAHITSLTTWRLLIIISLTFEVSLYWFYFNSSAFSEATNARVLRKLPSNFLLNLGES